MDILVTIAERKIAEAIEDGAFDHLDGKGQPIAFEDNPFEDEGCRMAHRLLRNNGFAPSWIEESNEIEREIANLEEEAARGAILRETALQDRAAGLNRRIERFNLTVPVAGKEKSFLKVPGGRKTQI
jgi:hypothetical protein